MPSYSDAWNTLCPLYLITDTTSTSLTTSPTSTTTTPQKPIAQQYNEASKL
jgi:hypothetical protein